MAASVAHNTYVVAEAHSSQVSMSHANRTTLSYLEYYLRMSIY